MQNEIISSMLINMIPYGRGFLKSAFDITLDIWKEEEYYLASFPLFDIEICEKSIPDVRIAFEEEICFLWDEYKQVSDQELSESAIKLKNKLSHYFHLCTLDDLEGISSSSGDFTPLQIWAFDTGFGYAHN